MELSKVKENQDFPMKFCNGRVLSKTKLLCCRNPSYTLSKQAKYQGFCDLPLLLSKSISNPLEERSN